MNRENGGLLFLVALLFGGAALSTTADSPRSSPGAGPSIAMTARASGVDCERGAHEILAEFLDIPPKRPVRAVWRERYRVRLGGSDLRVDEPSREEDDRSIALRDIIASAEKRGYAMEFLVATIPDPLDSHVGWLFDQQLDAIERAIEGTGHSLDRFSLPWECSFDDPAQSDAHREKPGVLLFKGADHLLVLFLVGETPTWGVQKDAMHEALDFIADWQAKTYAHERSISIVGPTFSGAGTSLRIVLSNWKERGKNPASTRLKIRSGSATGGDWLQEFFTKEGFEFQAVVHPDIALLREAAQFFESDRHGGSKPKIAVLAESGTSYGQSVLLTAQRLRAIEGFETMAMSFPLHVSRARSALQEVERRGRSDGADLAFDPQPALHVPLGDLGRARDVLPAMTGPLTSAAAEQSLATIFSTLSHEELDFVGIFASDVRDKLFLAKEIKRYLPDVQLFTTESHALFAHPRFRDELDGMIVVSTYPLYATNQIWSFPFFGRTQRTHFPSEAAQGAFNATTTLLVEQVRACGEPSEITHYGLMTPLEYGAPFALESGKDRLRRPPVWISVVGRGVAWPVAFEPEPRGEPLPTPASRRPSRCASTIPCASPTPTPLPYVYEWEQQTDPPRPTLEIHRPFSWYLGLLLVSGGVFLAWSHFRLTERPTDRVETSWEPLWYLEPAPSADERFVTARRYHSIGVFVVLIIGMSAFLMVFLAPAILEQRAFLEPTGWSPWDWRLQAAGLAAVLVVTITLLGRLFHVSGTRPPSLVVAVGSAILLLVFVWCITERFADSGQVAVFYARASDLASGVSPLGPVLFMAIALGWWFLCNLRRIAILERASSGRREPESGEAAGQEWHALASVARSPFFLRWPGMTLVLLAGVAMPALIVGGRTLPSFEGPLFNSFIRPFGMVAVLSTFVLGVGHFVGIWGRLRNVLDRAATEPWMSGFERLAPSILGGRSAFAAAACPAEALEASVTRALWLQERMTVPLIDPAALRATLATDLDAITRSSPLHPPHQIESQPALSRLSRELREALGLAEAHLPGVDDDSTFRDTAEEFVALETIRRITPYLYVLRRLLIFVTACAMLTLLTVSSYPFQPRGMLHLVTLAMVVTSVGSALLVLWRLDRHPVFRAVASEGGRSGSVASEYLLQALTYAVVPLLGLLASFSPELAKIFSQLDSAIRVFR